MLQNNTEDCYFIRPVELADIPYLYEICLKTGLCGKDASDSYNDKALVGQFYAAPYALFARDYSFVAVNKKTCCPAGYILGTGDSLEFYKKHTDFLKPLYNFCKACENNKSELEKNLKEEIAENIENPFWYLKNEQLYKEYPAHLHIDLLPELQKKGVGSSLMKVFLANLKEKNIKGVHLGVDFENTNAIAFYKKHGFTKVCDNPWGYTLGLKL